MVNPRARLNTGKVSWLRTARNARLPNSPPDAPPIAPNKARRHERVTSPSLTPNASPKSAQPAMRNANI